MATRIRKRLERYGALFVFWLANLLNRKAALRMGVFLADIAYNCMGKFRRVALENVDTAFKDSITKERKEEIARNAFRTLAKTMIDFVRFGKYSQSELLALASRVEGLEHLESAMKSSPGGVIGMSSHIGSWEYMGAWLVASGFPLAAVGKEQPDAVITKLMLQLRSDVGIEHIPRTRSGNKAIIKALNSKKVLGLIADQNGGKSGIFVPFFNKMAATFKGPAQLAMKKKVPIIMIATLWEDNEYIVKFFPPIEMVDTGDNDADLYENTLRCQNQIEQLVREYPDQWLWGHRRWKTRPPDESVDSGAN
ncbi:lysophospholipid acyltransferase family protein [bacterium]|nr:lysophospholipid acyltransferase family protein [bacterium]